MKRETVFFVCFVFMVGCLLLPLQTMLREQTMDIRQLTNLKHDKVIALSLEVCRECGSADFDTNGWETFQRFVYSNECMNELTIFGAFDNHALIGIIGIIGIRHNGSHISLFFINPDYHRKGIGTTLFNYAYAKHAAEQTTVNSSSFAVKFYESLVFF